MKFVVCFIKKQSFLFLLRFFCEKNSPFLKTTLCFFNSILK